MFFSNTPWPQLTEPFYPTLFETSICQFNSSKCSPIIPDEVGEHLTRDPRPFLHPESLQTLQIHSFFSSVHLTRLLQGSDQRTPDTRSETIPSSRITPDLQIHSFFSSVHLTRLLQGSDQRTPDTRSETIPSSRITPDLQIHSFFSSVHLTHLLQGSDQRTPDTRSETIPSSRITPDLQIHSFFSSVHLTHLLQGSDQRTPDTRSETIPSSRITPDPSDSQLLLFSSPHSSSTGFRSENTWHEIRDHSFIQNHSRSSDTQLLLFSSLTHLLQGSDQRTPDKTSETIPSSRITPDLQIHSFSSSVHLTHLLQGSGQRTPDPRSETIPSSRITPDPSDSQLLLFSSPHSCSTGFWSEDWNGQSRSMVLCSVTHFTVVFEVCVWIIVRFEDPIMAHNKISNRVSHFDFLSVGIWKNPWCHVSKQDVQDLQQKYRPTTSKIQQYNSLYTWGTMN